MRASAGLLCALVCLLLPASAGADLLEFTGSTGKQSGKAWFPDAGLKGYHLSVTVNGAVQGCRGQRCRIEVSVGEYFSTEGFPDGAKLVWGIRYRKRDGPWHGACVPDSGNCEFTMPGGKPWPGNPAGGQHFPVRMWARAPRNIHEIQVRWGAVFEKKHGTWVGAWPRSKTFRVRYHVGDGILPSSNTSDSQPGCANIRFDSRVTGIAVCVQYESCSPIKQTGPPPRR
jgi:hypothetical protein